MSSLRFIVSCIFYYFCQIDAYSEIIMYEELFDSSDGWSFSGSYTFPSTNILCVNASSCLELANSNGIAEKTWSFTGYHDIHVQFDVVSNGAAGSFRYDYSYVAASGSFGSVLGKTGSYQATPTLFRKDEMYGLWSDKTSFTFKLKMTGSDSSVKIYISNFRFYGTPYLTASPTKEPTLSVSGSQTPTTDPSKHPTTSNPTDNPTDNPTIDPTSNPIIDPTSHPTIDPTNSLTLHPISQPPSYQTTSYQTTSYPTTSTTAVLSTTKTTQTAQTTLTDEPIADSTSTTTTSHTQDGIDDADSPKTDTNSGNSKELILWSLIFAAGLIWLVTTICCIVVICLFCRNRKISKHAQTQLHLNRALGEKKNHNKTMRMTDVMDVNTQNVIVSNTEIEMGHIGGMGIGETTLPSNRNRNIPKYTDPFEGSESRSNSDMYARNDNFNKTPHATNDGNDGVATSPGFE